MALIEKNTPEKRDFDAEMRAAAEAAGVPPDSELYAEYGVETPEPDEAGRISTSRSAEEEAAVEATVSESAAEPEPTPAPEAPVKDIGELEKKLGQVINENAELRRRQDEIDQYAQQPAPLTEQTVGWFDEMAEQNPLEAAQWAVQNQQPILYDRAIRTAYEQDPVAAGRYERQIEQAQLVGHIQAQIQPQIAEAQQVAQRQQLDQALSSVMSKHDDFAQVVGSLNDAQAAELVQNGFPLEVLQGLWGDQAAKERVFETLYRWRKSDQAGQLVEAAAESAAQRAEETRAAKRAATVASASTTVGEPAEETEAERLERVWASDRPSLREGWTGRDTRPRIGR